MAFSRAVNFLWVLSSNALQRSLSVSARKAAVLPITKLHLRLPVYRTARYFHTSRPFCDKSSDNKSLNVDEEMLRYDYEEYEENVNPLAETDIDVAVEIPSHLRESNIADIFLFTAQQITSNFCKIVTFSQRR